MAKRKTKDERLDELVELLEQDTLDITQNRGGYPDLVQRIPGFVLIAGVDDDEPTLRVYDDAACLEWLKDIRDYQKENPDEDDLFYAINETTPKEWQWPGKIAKSSVCAEDAVTRSDS